MKSSISIDEFFIRSFRVFLIGLAILSPFFFSFFHFDMGAMNCKRQGFSRIHFDEIDQNIPIRVLLIACNAIRVGDNGNLVGAVTVL